MVLGGLPYIVPYTELVRKTSVYLDEAETRRLARLAREQGCSQAEILRAAVAAYEPPGSADRSFALAAPGFERIDGDPRAIADIPEEDLLEDFGE